MAMTMLLSYGYEDVNSLKGGYGAWLEAGYAKVGGAVTLVDNYSTMLSNMVAYNTVKADALLIEMIEDTPPFILDVRSTAELEEQGHIEGAFHIPLNELAQHTDLLPAFDTPIVVYCGTGWRATIGMTALHGMGWTDVRALKYKFADWVADGNPVVDGVPEAMVLDVVTVPEGILADVDSALIAVKDAGIHWGVNPAEDVNLALGENSDLIIIDVRKPEELAEKGVIAVVDQELIAVPIENLIADASMLPADKDAEIVVYCGSGHRSTMAMTMMLTQGYTNVTSLKGGFGGWVEAGLPVAEFVPAE
jgi:rhodanese-related sulfurtransferase